MSQTATYTAKHRLAPGLVKNFHRYDHHTRASNAANFRFTAGQRVSLGEVFWTHELVPSRCFDTRKQALQAAERAEQQSVEVTATGPGDSWGDTDGDDADLLHCGTCNEEDGPLCPECAATAKAADTRARLVAYANQPAHLVPTHLQAMVIRTLDAAGVAWQAPGRLHPGVCGGGVAA